METYEKSKMPSYHPDWFITGARVESPHHNFHGVVIGFHEHKGMPEDGVILTDEGQVIVTNMTSDFFKERK